MPVTDPTLIVIADDNPGDRLLAIKALRKGGVDNPVLEVEDGQQLLELLRGDTQRGRRVVVFLDINMPRMNGIEALALLKADPVLRGAEQFRIPLVRNPTYLTPEQQAALTEHLDPAEVSGVGWA